MSASKLILSLGALAIASTLASDAPVDGWGGAGFFGPADAGTARPPASPAVTTASTVRTWTSRTRTRARMVTPPLTVDRP